MLSSWEVANNDSLKELVLDSARALINGIDLPISKVLRSLKKVSSFKNQICALSIIYFSCDDKKGVVDEEYNRILKRWNLKECKG